MTTTMDTATRTPARNSYARLWADVPRELGFLLPTLPIVIAGFVVAITLFATAVGMAFIVIGFFLMLAALFIGRAFGTLELARLRGAGMRPIEPPRWDRKAPAGSGIRRLFAPFVDGHYWLYLLHTLVVNFIVGIVTWTVAFAWTVTGVASSLSWIGTIWFPQNLSNGQPVLTVLGGLVLVATLPFVLRGLVLLHQGIARGMLASFESDALREQVSGLSASRTAAVAAEGTALRRLERDIHDGPQQRLVRLQMDLAAADRQLDADPAAARALLAEALQQSRDALEELRALSRGFAPPILLDRGLVAALESLAARSTVTAEVASTLPAGTDLPPELERNAYFIAAEAVTNAAKHAGARHIGLAVALRRLPQTDQTWLDVTVTDDGRGGAAVAPGHGLAGLQERVQGLGGVMELTSPAGGPTTVSVHLPVNEPAS